jgi:hypothetical protein
MIKITISGNEWGIQGMEVKSQEISDGVDITNVIFTICISNRPE